MLPSPPPPPRGSDGGRARRRHTRGRRRRSSWRRPNTSAGGGCGGGCFGGARAPPAGSRARRSLRCSLRAARCTGGVSARSRGAARPPRPRRRPRRRGRAPGPVAAEHRRAAAPRIGDSPRERVPPGTVAAAVGWCRRRTPRCPARRCRRAPQMAERGGRRRRAAVAPRRRAPPLPPLEIERHGLPPTLRVVARAARRLRPPPRAEPVLVHAHARNSAITVVFYFEARTRHMETDTNLRRRGSSVRGSRLDGLDDALRLRREAAADHQPWSIGLE